MRQGKIPVRALVTLLLLGVSSLAAQVPSMPRECGVVELGVPAERLETLVETYASGNEDDLVAETRRILGALEFVGCGESSRGDRRTAPISVVLATTV